jgi:murein DD-endopeptidase MepM/ murein hydrolase activator NlpD
MMDKETKEILETLKEIYRNKNLVKEVSSMSPHISGGKNITIPATGAHKGQSGWQSANAWDIKMNIGDPVYAVADGTVITFSNYGPDVRKVDGKKLFGAGFTVDSDGGLPDIYYTHLMNTQVKKGDKIKCGQLLGYVMDFPGSSYDHLHIGVEDNNIKRFLDDSGNLRCAKGKKLTSQEISSPEKTKGDENTDVGSKVGSALKSLTTTSGPRRYSGSDNLLSSLVGSFLNMKESKKYGNFGQNAKITSNSVFLPSADNPSIDSPIEGEIKSTNFLGCTNELSVLHEIDGEEFYLTYCNITSPAVSVGDQVRKGSKLGDTTKDINIRVFDFSGNLLSLTDVGKKKTDNKKKSKRYSDDDYERYNTPKGPKRYSDSDTFVSDVVKFPFKLIRSLTKGGLKSVTEEKLNKDINNIKRLL